MNRIISPLNSQQGSVMALALMVMVTLTIVGLTALNDTVLESSITRNHALYRNNLYLAEAAVRQAVQVMEDYTDDNNVTDELMQTSGSWVRHYVNFDFGDDPDWCNMNFQGGNFDVFIQALEVPNQQGESGFLVRYEGIAAGSSLDMTDPTSLYQFSVYGRGVGPMMGDPTQVILKVGYRMRY